jgi:nucleoid DNA-binding protein
VSLGKKDIIDNIKSKAHIPKNTSKELLEKFLFLIKNNKDRNIKLPKFGIFYTHKSPSRIGRNPKTKQNFIIPIRKKLSFKASYGTKKILN